MRAKLNGRAELTRKSEELFASMAAHLADHGRLGLVKAPPGSGKTHTLLRLVDTVYQNRLRVAIAAQTNSQADDICERLARDYPGITAFRFASSGYTAALPVPSVTKADDLPHHCVAVGTVAKWAMVDIHHPFNVLMIDEAWQMS